MTTPIRDKADGAGRTRPAVQALLPARALRLVEGAVKDRNRVPLSFAAPARHTRANYRLSKEKTGFAHLISKWVTIRPLRTPQATPERAVEAPLRAALNTDLKGFSCVHPARAAPPASRPVAAPKRPISAFTANIPPPPADHLTRPIITSICWRFAALRRSPALFAVHCKNGCHLTPMLDRSLL